MLLFDKTNINSGTYQEILTGSYVKHLSIQYKIIAGADNTVELQIWGTVFNDCDNNTDDDWLNITEFLTGMTEIIITNDNIHDISLIDTHCNFSKIKIKYIVTNSSPDNKVKIGWGSTK